MATDPVCGMTVDRGSAAGTFVFGGRTYYFCSVHCLRAFEANPKHSEVRACESDRCDPT